MRESRKVCPLAREELAALRNAGCVLTDDDVILINALSDEVMCPRRRQELSRGRPVFCGGAWLWPFTLAASDWWHREGCLIGGDDDMVSSMAYAMAHGRGDIEATTEADVWRWRRSLVCTLEELAEAVQQVLDQGERDVVLASTSKESASYGELVRMMMELHGGDVVMWERYVSLDYVLEMLITLRAQGEAGGRGSALKDRANAALALAIYEIEKREGVAK